VSKCDLAIAGDGLTKTRRPAPEGENNDVSGKTDQPLMTPQLYDGTQQSREFKRLVFVVCMQKLKMLPCLRFTDIGKDSKESSVFVRTRYRCQC
jgi:hypothetical protein